MSRQSDVVIHSAVERLQAAALRLQGSKFSVSAIETFRANISGQLKRDSRVMAEMGWYEGNGTESEFTFDQVNHYIDEQLHFLELWIADIQQTQTLPGGVGRAALYGESLGQVYQRYYVAARGLRAGLPDLPAYPRDGSTVCRVYCRCQWQIKKRSDALYEATWKLGQAEHCPDCILRAKQWNPLRLMWFVDVGEWRMFDVAGNPVEA
jgi:hypothetical protein